MELSPCHICSKKDGELCLAMGIPRKYVVKGNTCKLPTPIGKCECLECGDTKNIYFLEQTFLCRECYVAKNISDINKIRVELNNEEFSLHRSTEILQNRYNYYIETLMKEL